MQTETISNNEAADFGREAATQWTKGATANGRGNANGIIALMIAQETMTFTATYTVGKEQPVMVAFDIVDYFEGRTPRNADGSKINKASSAMLAEIFAKVFGIVEHTPAQRSAIDQCGKIVLGLRNKGLCSADLSLSKGGFLRVPFVLMNDKPNEKASESAQEDYEARINSVVTLDGTKGKSVAELSKRVAPKAETRAPQAPAAASDPAKDMASAIGFVSACVDQVLKSDESDVSFSKELDASMFDLKTRLDAYFKAYPVEAKGKRTAGGKA